MKQRIHRSEIPHRHEQCTRGDRDPKADKLASFQKPILPIEIGHSQEHAKQGDQPQVAVTHCELIKLWPPESIRVTRSAIKVRNEEREPVARMSRVDVRHRSEERRVGKHATSGWAP